MTEFLDLNTNSTASQNNIGNFANLNTSFGHDDPSVAVGLNGINRFSAEEPFINLLKHTGGSGVTGSGGIRSLNTEGESLDFPFLLRNGNLTLDGTINSLPEGHDSLGFTFYSRNQPVETVSGTYVFLYTGTANIQVNGAIGSSVNIISNEPGKIVFEVIGTDNPIDGEYTITASDINTANPE